MKLLVHSDPYHDDGKIEKGAGAEARKPLTRPADAKSRAVTCAGPRINLDPFKGTGSRCCPWHALALPLYRRLGSLVPNKPVYGCRDGGDSFRRRRFMCLDIVKERYILGPPGIAPGSPV